MRRQQDTAKAWCESNGYALASRSFDDKGKSGWKGENFKGDGALKEFIQLHEKGHISRDAVLIIDSVDRFSRLPVSKSASHFLEVVNAGIGLVFSGSYDKRIITSALLDKEPYILQSVIGELNRAHTESSEKSRKIIAAKAAKKAKIQAGEIVPHNNIPKYFTYVPITKTHGKYVHNENTKIVLMLANGILAGKSLYEMACDLNNRGIPTIRRKCEWSPASIRQILKNRILIGEYLGQSNYVLPIIDNTTFLNVQNILSNNAGNRGKKGDVVNVFRGICFCAECGKAMNALSAKYKGVTYRYLRCSNYVKKNSCTKAYLRLELVEREFFYHFLCKNPYQLINDDDAAEVKAIREDITAKTAKQNQVKEGIEKIIALVEALPMDELKNKLAMLHGERDRLRKEIDSLNAKVSAIQDTPEDSDDWLIKITRFGEGENGEDITHVLYEDTIAKITEALADKEAREKLRVRLPAMIGKITVDSKARRFTVWNRMGRAIYQSGKFSSLSNNTALWRQSLKTWTKRKVGDGRLITCKRYQRKAKV